MAIYPAGALYVLRSPAWVPDDRNRWEQIEVAPEAESRAVISRAGREAANALMVTDLVRAIEKDGKPCCSEEDGRWTIEMVHGVYQAQKSGSRVNFPLESRRHALDG
jgi:hypothetical protein